jgi:hypothetical protein
VGVECNKRVGLGLQAKIVVDRKERVMGAPKLLIICWGLEVGRPDDFGIELYFQIRQSSTHEATI